MLFITKEIKDCDYREPVAHRKPEENMSSFLGINSSYSVSTLFLHAMVIAQWKIKIHLLKAREHTSSRSNR